MDSRRKLLGTRVAQLDRVHELTTHLRMTKTAFRKVLEEILDVTPGSLKESDTRDTIDGWSSLTDVQILSAIYSELGIDAESDAFAFESIGELLTLLEANQAFSAY